MDTATGKSVALSGQFWIRGINTMSNRQNGTVKSFDDEKGTGYITPQSGGEELFVHFKMIETDGFKTLTEGQHVTYVAQKGLKGMQAAEVRPE
ncbi:UNVERIFIED_ORG: CspA family cold shock protein [Pseudomonas fluorescens]|jgi:CspA family cold shock protein